MISLGQGLIALGITLKGIWVKLACIGSIIFFLSPLGVGAAFPFPFITAFAAYLIMKRDDLDYIWKLKMCIPSKSIEKSIESIYKVLTFISEPEKITKT